MTATDRVLQAIADRTPRRLCGYHGGAWSRTRPSLIVQAARVAGIVQPAVWCLDLYDAEQWRQAGAAPIEPRIYCQPDWPAGRWDLAILELSRESAAELACELLQAAWTGLETGGDLWVAVDNPRDHWTRRQLGNYASSIRVEADARQVWYHATKQGESARHRKFECEFAFRDRGELIWVTTRPGVFSHRRLDNGARQLIRALPVGIPDAILDLGCGSGAVALAAARANPQARVVAVDSNARALQVLAQSMARNEISTIERVWNWDGNFGEEGAFAWVFANPPYFAQQRIAAQFIGTARRVLRPTGRLVLVTKAPREIAGWVAGSFEEVQVHPGPNYTLVTGRVPG